MTRLPVARRDSVRPVESGKSEVIESNDEASHDFGAFSSFRYSYTEVSAFGGKARVKSRRASLEDGKLVSESFEGDLNRDTYDQMMGQAQQLFQDQMRQLLGPWA